MWAINLTASYIIMTLARVYLMPNITGVWSIILTLPFVHAARMLPLFVTLVLFLTTTKSSDLIGSLYQMKLPQWIIIPTCIAIRYFPAFKEDYFNITNSMKLRRVRGIKKIKCIYLPLLASSTKLSDELTERKG